MESKFGKNRPTVFWKKRKETTADATEGGSEPIERGYRDELRRIHHSQDCGGGRRILRKKLGGE